MPTMLKQGRQDDLVRGGSAVLFWCVPAVALFVSVPLGDDRWWIWSPALVVMGVACLANAARCGRLHCYITGPVFLIGAVVSMLRGTHQVSVPWNWIVGGVLIGWASGYVLEFFAGSYVERGR